MSERFKYANNGVYKVENFEQRLADRWFPDYFIGYFLRVCKLYITVKVREEDNQVYPFITFRRKQKLKIRAFFNIKSKFSSLDHTTNQSNYLESGQGVFGPSINIQDVLNEENGYLENGALTVEYGFQVDAIIGRHDIWRFNLYDIQFNSENNIVTVKDGCHYGVYYSPKPLLTFHSLLFKPESKQVNYQIGAYTCLQIVNGVRPQPLGFDNHSWLDIAEVGRHMKLMNVVHYCDQKIYQTCPDPLKNGNLLKKAIKLNARRCVSRMIGLWDFKELLEELREDLDEMPGEMMKVICRSFFMEEF